MAYYNTAIVKAGLELGVWAKIAAGQPTAQQIAQNAGWDVTGTRRLLDALCAIKLLRYDEAGYHLSPEAEWYLLPEKRTYIGDAWLVDVGWEERGQLANAIRSGKRPVVANYTDAENAPLWVGHFAGHLAAPEKGLTEFDQLWQSLNIKAREGLRILDVACGTGKKSLALARHHTGVQVTLLDRPSVLQVAMEIVGRLGLTDQVTALPGDLQTIDYGRGQFDVVWFGAITHHFGPPDIVNVLGKAFTALAPGGTVVINTAIGDEACRTDELLLTAIEMFIISAQGGVYTQSEYRGFLEQAGFVDATRVGPTLVKAVRP